MSPVKVAPPLVASLRVTALVTVLAVTTTQLAAVGPPPRVEEGQAPEPGSVEIEAAFRAMVWGRVPVEFKVGEGVARLEVLLDGQTVASLVRPPWRAALKLGMLPEPHVLEVQAFDEMGELTSRDRRSLNKGQGRLSVQIRRPTTLQPGERVLVDLDVDLPRGRRPVPVELRWGEQLLHRFDGPPYRRVIEFPSTPSWLRAVAFDRDGKDGLQPAAEDIVMPQGDERDYRYQSEVSMVELYVSARDGRGDSVLDLEAGELIVREAGKERPVRFVEPVPMIPLTVALVLDASESMEDDQETVRAAAQQFVERLAPGDRALVVAFSERPEHVIGPTDDGAAVRAALEGIEVGSSTALHEAMAYAVVQLRGVVGRRAVVLLTDGRDSSGRFSLQQASTVVRRAGLPLFLVRLEGKEGLIRRPGRWMMLDHFVGQTGGHVSSLGTVDEVSGVWQDIAAELASQLRVGFRSEARGPGWRRLEIDTTRAGVKLRAPDGYWRGQ